MNRLFWKFFFAFWLALALMLAGLLVAFSLYNEAKESNSSIVSGGRAEFTLRQLEGVMRNVNDADLKRILLDRPDNAMPVPMMVDDQGRDFLGRVVVPDVLAQARATLKKTNADSSVLQVSTREGNNYLIFQPRREGSHLEEPLHPPRGLGLPASILIAALFAGMGVSFLLARHFSRPIQNLNQAFRAVALGQLSTRIGDSMGQRRDEITQLGLEFDKMTERLEQSLAAQKRLLHDISHELRSPLARQQVAIALARQNPERLDLALDRIERESARLDELVGQVLTLARLESAKQAPEDEFVDLIELIQDAVDNARFEASQTGRSIQVFGLDEQASLIMQARGELLYRAIENVVRNALGHTPEDSCVEISCRQEAGYFHLLIADHGTGIAETDLERIFEPFWRAEGGQGGGYGLGLAIARRAVEAHRGKITARNRSEGGLLMELILPLGAVVNLSASDL